MKNKLVIIAIALVVLGLPLTISPSFADDQKDNQRNVYDVFRQWDWPPIAWPG